MHYHAYVFPRLLGIIVIMTDLIITSAQTNMEYTHSITPEKMSKYKFTNGTIRYCVPILDPDYCEEGREIKPCLRDGDPDRCEPCPGGKANIDRTTSDFQTPCYSFSCPENSIQVEKRPDGCNEPCVCNHTAGFVKDYACMCKLVDFACEPNTFLNVSVRKDKCTPCPAGSHKPGTGYGPCVPLPSTQNNQTLNRTAPHLPENVTKSTENSTDDINDAEKSTQRDTVGGESTNEPRTKSSAVAYQSIIIIVVTATVLILLVFAIFLICRMQRQRGKVPQLHINGHNVQIGGTNVMNCGVTEYDEEDETLSVEDVEKQGLSSLLLNCMNQC